MDIYEIFILILMVLFGGLSLYLKTKNNLLSKANELIGDAEALYKDTTKAGGRKFEWVVAQLYALIPAPLRVVFSKELLGTVVQGAFDLIERYTKMQLDKVIQ